MLLAMRKLALIDVTIFQGLFPFTMWQVLVPLALIYGPIRFDKDTMALQLVFMPLASVFASVSEVNYTSFL